MTHVVISNMNEVKDIVKLTWMVPVGETPIMQVKK